MDKRDPRAHDLYHEEAAGMGDGADYLRAASGRKKPRESTERQGDTDPVRTDRKIIGGEDDVQIPFLDTAHWGTG